MLPIIIRYFIFCLISSILLSLLEIQIEGKNGWAEKLPTWRINLKIFNILPGLQKPLTGYHVYFFGSIFFIMHIPFLFMRWDIYTEIILISAYMLITRWEDFLWFVFNPNYGLKKFHKEHISWHPDWFGPIPTQYIYSFIIWVILFMIGFRII
jgi:hypothetical protein